MLATGNFTIDGSPIALWVGRSTQGQRGPVLIYWHGGGNAQEEVMSIGASAMAEILDRGGLIAAPISSNQRGQFVGPDWYTGDFEAADELVGCASMQLNTDPRRIYTLGTAGGALQASAMAFLRASYIAAAVSNSGGLANEYAIQPSAAVPAVLSIYAADQSELWLIDFAATSKRLASNITALGGFATECAHSGTPTQAPAPLVEAAWRFLIDHPYGVRPLPYAAGLPAVFPGYCWIHR